MKSLGQLKPGLVAQSTSQSKTYKVWGGGGSGAMILRSVGVGKLSRDVGVDSWDDRGALLTIPTQPVQLWPSWLLELPQHTQRLAQ